MDEATNNTPKKTRALAQRAFLVHWVVILSLILIVVAVIANFRVGTKSFKQEMADHWPNGKSDGTTLLPRTKAPGAATKSLEETYNDIARMLNCVTVSIDGSRAVNGQLERVHGSGIIVGPQDVLTNLRIVEGASQLGIHTYSPMVSAYSGQVTWADAENDLALIRVNTNTPLPCARLGNSDSVNAGDFIFTMGNPVGSNSNVFTSGTVCDRGQTFNVGTRTYHRMIRTQTYMSPGSSGGPLANIYGEIIGINTAISGSNGEFTGFSLSTPINRVASVAQTAQAAAGVQPVVPRPSGNYYNEYSLAA